jgi:LAO/AO transport system kinase
MKAGLMEIADIFVVNKADRPDADAFVRGLKAMLAPAFMNHHGEVPVLKTVAATGEGIGQLALLLEQPPDMHLNRERRLWMLTERVWQLVQKEKMRGFSKENMLALLQVEISKENFNLYRFAQSLSNA